MMKKTHIAVLIFAVLILALFIVGQQKAQKNIEIIYFRYAYEDNNYYRKIDLKNKEYWKAGPEKYGEDVEYLFVSCLEDEKIDVFLNTCHNSGFLSWDEEYLPDNTSFNSNMWWITIHYSDSSEQKMRGHGIYPETWDEVGIALRELTGDLAA